jgi:tetratricopeptide (TPR) repeat protein
VREPTEDFSIRLEAITADMAAGKRAQALQAAKILLEGYPKAARAHNIFGILSAGEGDGEGAIASFEAAIVNEPSFGEGYYNLALVLCQQGRHAQAIEPLERAVSLNPEIAPYHLVLGNALRGVGRSQEALAAYHRALGIGGIPEALIRNNLGGVYLDSGLLDDAITSFRRAVHLDPNVGEYRENLATALRRAGRLSEALQALTQAATQDPRSARAAALLANTMRDVGRFEEAVTWYRHALKLRPDDKQSAYHLGLTLLDLGRTGEGLHAIAEGPGVLRVSATAKQPPAGKLLSADVSGPGTPTFIGGWKSSSPDLCDDLVAFYHRNPARHAPGRTGSGIDRTSKDSSDLTVLPCDVNTPGHEPVARYFRHLEQCYQAYAEQWSFLGGILPHGEIMPFTIQRYDVGGHFQRVHSERNSISFAHRVLAWMTYLNDVEEGGETRFHHFGLEVRPERGKTLIWPAEWTHAHSGGVVRKGEKYIITGWIHFPLHRP